LKWGNGLPFVDRIMLCETFLHWSATHLFRVLAVIVPALYLLFDIQAVHASVVDAIWHLAPFVVVQSAIFLWLTGGRVMPLMTDLYQMLCATEVLKSAWVGLLRPKGQKFKVTAKGGDRSKQLIQWLLLRIFGILLLLTTLGILNAFVIDPSRPLAESAAIALFWSWYNIVILLLCCYVCAEQQQRRNGERFDIRIPVKLGCNGDLRDYFASDISVSGMHLLGELPASVGTAVRIRFSDISVTGHVRRRTETGIGLQFENSSATKIAILRYIFSGKHSITTGKIRPYLLPQAISARVFR